MSGDKDIFDFEVPDSEAEKEEMQRAIALSLEQQQPPRAQKRKVVVLVSDDEDGADQILKRPSTTIVSRHRTVVTYVSARHPEKKQRTVSECKQMELERLARAKAKAKENERAETEVKPMNFYDRAAAAALERAGEKKKKMQLVDLSSPEPERLPALKFGRGVVKKTFRTGQQQQKDEIRIEEVLEKETLVTTLLSSFQWDLEWILKKLPLDRNDHNVVFVMHAKEEQDRRMKEAFFKGLPRVEAVFPNMEGQVNCMHSKLMLLFHRDLKSGREWLRIAVPTANLTDYDWGMMGGVMENMVFMIDLPRMEIPNPEQTFFLEELLHFCSEQGIPEHILNDLVHHDFSATKEMAFVHTIGGSHAKDWEKTGFCGLGRAIKKLGYSSGKGLEVDYVTSSLGAAKPEFISTIYRAAQGHTGIKDLQRRSKGSIKSAPPKRGPKDFFGRKVDNAAAAEESTDDERELEEETNWDSIRQRFRVFFPSIDTVHSSQGGERCAGTICFQRQWWNAPTFPKTLLRDTKSVRQGTLMHNKLLLARPARTLNSKNGKMAAWAYVGSANLSESAWGRLVLDRATKSPKINCKNWECGVIIPVPAENLGRKLSGEPVEQKGPPEMTVFRGVVPVPMKTPGEPLGDKQPWFFLEASS
ncbi:tyrosyl-DNA phosphodiesterase domain protein [Sphaerosporella brunnea]|uniref:Tyrosyl-DNA phosphodiesterase domain protein n=1 Tax=Sphaerosporella brunnea TaxID=1250544 RepID=A0A5J5F832_9PEZI|nr:tyrosyl-DNA phosphodiesterase domain protein [Sphaerosporella brunnea]